MMARALADANITVKGHAYSHRGSWVRAFATQVGPCSCIYGDFTRMVVLFLDPIRLPGTWKGLK